MKNAYGFIYIVTNLITGRKYIGRKCYFLSNGRESDWKTYMGSCSVLLEDIKRYEIINFKREIIYECKTLQSLCRKEELLQKKYNVLTAKNENGERLWYNQNIGGKRFYRPAGWHHTEHTKKKMSILKREQLKNPKYIRNMKRAAKKRQIKLVREGRHNFLGGKIQSASSKARAKKGLLRWQINPPKAELNSSFKGYFSIEHPKYGKFYNTYAGELCKKLKFLNLDGQYMRQIARGEKSNFRAEKYKNWKVIKPPPSFL